MLSSEFAPEMGALLRSLEQKVVTEPSLRHEEMDDVIRHIERAIVTLCALHIKLRSIK